MRWRSPWWWLKQRIVPERALGWAGWFPLTHDRYDPRWSPETGRQS